MSNNSQKLTDKPPLLFKKVIVTGVVFVFVLTTLLPVLPFSFTVKAQTETSTSTEEETQESSSPMSSSRREELEQQLEETLLKIKEQEQIISEVRSEKRTLQGEINQLDARINTLNLQIEAVELNLEKLDQDIFETQRNINRTQNRIKEHKEALAEAIQKVYETEKESLLAILLKNNQISDFFNNVNDILLVQNNIRNSLDRVVNLRQELIKEKEELNQERQDVENLKNIRENQIQQERIAQNQKRSLLQETRNEEAIFQERLEETRKTASEIRSQIFRLVGGGELTFETAYELAKLAESATGIRAALIMAILDRESLLGKNVGGCYYDGAMHPSRDVPVFMAITDTLGINPNSEVAKVSCPLSYGWGGAMGPSQFIPSTWAIYGGYEKINGQWQYNASRDRIRQVSGSDGPSNPWNNADAFTATALYIKDLYDSQGCKNFAEKWAHSYPRQESREECATSKYYAGGNWENYVQFYGIPVVSKADEIQQDIDVISS